MKNMLYGINASVLKFKMNHLEAVRYIAEKEGRMLKPSRNICDVQCAHPSIPYFALADDRVIGYNFATHDNASRMSFFSQVMEQWVLPNVKNYNKSSPLYFNIELHDTYSYLTHFTEGMYKNCLTWSKRKCDVDVVVMPDCYHLTNYGGKLANKDSKTFSQKQNKIGFWGTTTGNKDPLKNERINMCLWAMDHRDKTDIFITHVAQIPLTELLMKVPEFPKLYQPYKQLDEMCNYKFLLDIPGNTCSWDRVPYILNTNSLLFKYPCQDMCFYYPLLQEGTHYVGVDKSDMFNKANFYYNNPKEAELITSNANTFVKQYLNPTCAISYMKWLFQESLYWNAP